MSFKITTDLESFFSLAILLKRSIKIKRLPCHLSSDFGEQQVLPTSPRVVDCSKNLKLIFKKHWRGSLQAFKSQINIMHVKPHRQGKPLSIILLCI